MAPESLEVLLEKLNTGDPDAAEQIFVAYEPYLRMVVRRQLPARLRSRFDSQDVVQSVWADVLCRFRQAGYRFRSAAELKAFLVKATRHRFIDRVRQHQHSADRQRVLDTEMVARTPALDPRPSQIVAADEMWEQILALCPPAHHQLVALKRDGRPLAEIASRTGLHQSSVRRILYELAQRLQQREAR